MDSRIRLDYALFQLTPTRTRCDLVICAGECKEKLASGLLQPFVAHLQFAKDEISKGGYSVTLSAPASACWFTKGTLERFVRFVSTPEVLERFVTIEKEIKNIDRSINPNGSSDTQTIYSLDENFNKSAAFAHKHEDNTSESLHEDDSKLHLQRALETRKTVLQREQAMVYARALVAGFETEFLQDLICFSDAFGSPRLREACLKFLELCNIKSNDRVWMDEVAAMQAYPRSQFSYMEDDLATELRINVQNSNLGTMKHNGSVDGLSNESHVPQYMHSYYQGYPFPYYQGNHPWPANMEDSRSTKRSHKKRSKEFSEESDSSSESESDSGSNKRSSAKKVIIKNINYISSSKNEESGNESEADENLEGKNEGQKVTQQWDIFQNLLLMDADDRESNEEHVSHKFEDPNIIPSGNQPEYRTISSTMGKHEETDWYLRSQTEKETQDRSRDIFEDHIKVVESTKDVLDKYPLTVEALSVNGYSDSQLKTHDSLMFPESNLTEKTVEGPRVNEPNDLHMVLERGTAGQQAVPAWTPEMESESSDKKIVKMDSPEVNKSKTKDLNKKRSIVEVKSKALAGSRRKTPAATKTVLKGRSEKEEERRKRMEELLTQRQRRIAERSATASTVKTANNNKPKAQPKTKIDKPKAQQTAKNSKPKAEKIIKNDKPRAQTTVKNSKLSAQQTPNNNTSKAQLASQDMKSSKKTVIRSSTIDRLSAARVVNPKVLRKESKPSTKPMKPSTKRNGELKPVYKPTKVTAKENGVSRTLVSQKAAAVEKNKVKPDRNAASKNKNGPKKKILDHNKSKELPKASEIKKTGNGVAQTGVSAPASVVLQKTTTFSDSNCGSTAKAVNSVSFKLNENFSEAKRNHISKVTDAVTVKEILTPVAAKAGPERSSSRKKWSGFETSSKALSGFKKLLSFGKRS